MPVYAHYLDMVCKPFGKSRSTSRYETADFGQTSEELRRNVGNFGRNRNIPALYQVVALAPLPTDFFIIYTPSIIVAFWTVVGYS